MRTTIAEVWSGGRPETALGAGHPELLTSHFIHGQRTRSFGTTWMVPAGAATATVMVGTFGPDWNGVYSWNGKAATFAVF
jgi:hypothetical protein